jgi:hypothetical protein
MRIKNHFAVASDDRVHSAAWTDPFESKRCALLEGLASVVPRTSKGGAELEMEVGPLRFARCQYADQPLRI